MKEDFVKAILANTEKQLAKPSITGDLREMLRVQEARLLKQLLDFAKIRNAQRVTKTIKKKVKSRIKTKKKK